MDVIIEDRLIRVNDVQEFIRNNIKDIKFLFNNKKDINLDLLKLIAVRLDHINDIYQFIELNSSIFNSIDSFFWRQKINIMGGPSKFYEYLINLEKLSYDFLIYIDKMVQIDFDDENFKLKYDRYDDYYYGHDDDDEFHESYFLLRWYKLPEGKKLIKYFLTHLKRRLTYAEAEFVLETVDVELFEAAKKSLLDTSIIPNDKFVFMFICYFDEFENSFQYQKDVDKVIECLNWVFNNNYNIILRSRSPALAFALDVYYLEDKFSREGAKAGDLDLRILKWFKAHDITIQNLESDSFINRSKDVIKWVVKNLSPITSYRKIYLTFSLTFEEFDELIQAKILPIPTLKEIYNTNYTMMIQKGITKIFDRIKDKYYYKK